MKTFAVSVLALVALVVPVSLAAATPAQVEAWKAEFPAAVPADSAGLRKMIAGYQVAVSRVTTTAGKALTLLKDKLTRDQITTQAVLHPPKPNPRITPAMRADAEEFGRWLNEKFAPYLARAPR